MLAEAANKLLEKVVERIIKQNKYDIKLEARRVTYWGAALLIKKLPKIEEALEVLECAQARLGATTWLSPYELFTASALDQALKDRADYERGVK